MAIQSKNQKTKRGFGQKTRMYEGHEVKPVMYVGWHVGRGKYMTGSIKEGELVCDENGVPIPLRNIGYTV